MSPKSRAAGVSRLTVPQGGIGALNRYSRSMTTTSKLIRSASSARAVVARYRRHLAAERDRRRPSKLAVMLEQAGPTERADLMAMISRYDAWDEVWGR
jgi:hypothetical protein